MFLFWLIVIVLLLVVMAILLPNLISPGNIVSGSASSDLRTIYRQQLDELDIDKSNQALEELKYETAKNELQRRYLNELEGQKSEPFSQMPDKRMAFALLTIIPTLALLIYFKFGSPISIETPLSTIDLNHPMSAIDHASNVGDLEPLLLSLESKLKNNPSDGNGWALLARSYVELKQHSKSIAAFENAIKYGPDDSQLYADYADAMAVVNGGSLNGQPEILIRKALNIDGNNVKAQLLAATLAFNQKDYKLAISYWSSLQKNLPKDSEVLPEVNASLEEAISISQLKVPSTNSETFERGAVSGVVSVSPNLIREIKPSSTVFIFAKAVNGRPMPLAIIRTTVEKLPFKYHLDDSNAMDPNYKLSGVDEVEVIARISRSGDAEPMKGDLTGKSRVKLQATSLSNIYIDSVIN